MTQICLRHPRLVRIAAGLGLIGLLAPQSPAAVTSVAASPERPSAKALADTRKSSADESRGLLNLGYSLTDRGDFDSAEIAFRQVLSKSGVAPNDTKTALLGLARMHRKQGALTKAAAIYEKYLKEFPGDERMPDALLELGRTLRSMGAYRLAIMRFYSVINSTLKLPPEGFDHYQQLAKTAQFEIAETHFQAGEFAEAGKFFARLRLLDLAPSDRARAHFKAGYALSLQGDHENAAATLHAYLEQWPDDENVPEARYLLAVNLRDLGRSQEAMVATLDLLRTEQARISSDPKRWAYWQRRTGNQLANDFFERGDILNAHAIYAGLAALSPDPTWRLPVLYQMALCQERLGCADRAHLAYEGIVDATKTNSEPELAELGRMAAWRLTQLDWNDTVRRQITGIFERTTGHPVVSPPTPNPASSL